MIIQEQHNKLSKAQKPHDDLHEQIMPHTGLRHTINNISGKT